MTDKKTQLKTLSGTVVSTKMKSTIVVLVDRYEKHPRYGKFIRSRKRYKVDAENGKAEEGDRVRIISCRPISKDKYFRLLDVTEKGSGGLSDTDSQGVLKVAGLSDGSDSLEIEKEAVI
ncbi:MAG: 30S ribosomal protein S17 [Candidatus Vogelbacteria bacterium CG10_big_fil_rev_8_21_14_0_10_45_14]|uniref:Small ribosomal subunit protein uS17 n=1 Tax=Candidatus Vogelbacteria bacterium CG10_big_fil_rev_8_21_14_0_10_45_14 TaxID=1975042 RepID=A0A2H0RJP8_9BACT|nr:MAG: 30S ribosomal protein S17 [Candidatus Vogelbacteria bacterium CG10_big_fil_rev_8_21_14_0_10_45_14]